MSFWDGLGAGLVSGASSLLGGTIGAIATHQENKYWANYNSPKEQMKRLSGSTGEIKANWVNPTWLSLNTE